MTDKTTSEVLNLAADLIEERGWVKGVNGWGKEGGGLCLEGGILAAIGYDSWAAVPSSDEFWSCPAYVAVSDHLGLDHAARNEDGDNTDPLWRYNDRRGRTASQVIEVLRATAVIEAARESQPAEVTR